MEDKHDRTENQSDRNEHSTPLGQSINPKHPEPTVIPNTGNIPVIEVNAKESAVHTPKGQSEMDPMEKTLEDRIKRAEKWMIAWTAIIAIATAANVWVFYRESESTFEEHAQHGRGVKRATRRTGEFLC